MSGCLYFRNQDGFIWFAKYWHTCLSLDIFMRNFPVFYKWCLVSLSLDSLSCQITEFSMYTGNVGKYHLIIIFRGNKVESNLGNHSLKIMWLYCLYSTDISISSYTVNRIPATETGVAALSESIFLFPLEIKLYFSISLGFFFTRMLKWYSRET